MAWQVIGFDIDGVLDGDSVLPPGSVIISGRTFAEYDDLCRSLAQQAPLYIRGRGWPGDMADAVRFKILMIQWFAVTEYWENNAYAASQIEKRTHCRVHREAPG
jgi:hypothetical protein